MMEKTKRTWYTVTKQYSGKVLKVLQYNILNPTGLHRESFPYTSKDALKWKFRKANLFKEIKQLDPDIFTLQELGFYDDWKEEFKDYDSLFLPQKGSEKTASGIGIFWRKKLDHYVVNLVDYQKVFYNEIVKLIENPNGYSQEYERNNVGQVLVLEFKGERDSFGLIIGNTHLFWKPTYNFIRCLQIGLLMKVISEQQSKYKYPILLCGDMNFTPDSLEYELVMNQTPHEEIVKVIEKGKRYFKNEFYEEKKDIIIESSIILSKLKLFTLKSAYSLYDKIIGRPDHPHNKIYENEPSFTVFTKFQGVLDYILHDDQIKVTKILEIPDPKYLGEGLPNDEFSSDHISIMAEISIEN